MPSFPRPILVAFACLTLAPLLPAQESSRPASRPKRPDIYDTQADGRDLVAAALLLISRRRDPEHVFEEIDWGLLVFFASLFVVTGATETSGPGVIDPAASSSRSRGSTSAATTATRSW